MRVGIFCGSRPGHDPVYQQAAADIGRRLAGRGIGLIYGGGRTGLMGAVADAVLSGGGDVHGVMPRHLVEKEIQHTGLTRLDIVETMHERKLRMAELADGFIALPGGVGTLEEIFEQWCWLMLGIHAKPCAFLNVNGYYDDLKQMMTRICDDGFMAAHHGKAALFDARPEVILDAFAAFKPPPVKWNEKA